MTQVERFERGQLRQVPQAGLGECAAGQRQPLELLEFRQVREGPCHPGRQCQRQLFQLDVVCGQREG